VLCVKTLIFNMSGKVYSSLKYAYFPSALFCDYV